MLLGVWSDAANSHSRIVAQFVNATGDRYRLQDQADDAIEAVFGAQAVYRAHREEHSLRAWRGLA
jgi:hypothetical protein